MAYWIDNADSYVCSSCGYECNNPSKLKYGSYMCPLCKSRMGTKFDDNRMERSIADRYATYEEGDSYFLSMEQLNSVMSDKNIIWRSAEDADQI